MTAEVVLALKVHLAYDGDVDRADTAKNERARASLEAEMRAELKKLIEIMKQEAINTGFLPKPKNPPA
jgi:hypothetical protein